MVGSVQERRVATIRTGCRVLGRPVITGDRAVVPVAPIRPRGDDGHLEQVTLVAALP